MPGWEHTVQNHEKGAPVCRVTSAELPSARVLPMSNGSISCCPCKVGGHLRVPCDGEARVGVRGPWREASRQRLKLGSARVIEVMGCC